MQKYVLSVLVVIVALSFVGCGVEKRETGQDGQNVKNTETSATEQAVTGIVSNNFHVYRACRYARKLGYQKVYPVPAGCHPVLFVNYAVREVFAVWKMWC